MDSLQQALVNAVKTYARANYEIDGWDYIVEAYSDDEILELIGGAKTEAAAIRAAGRTAKLHHSRREDIQAEAF